MEADGDRAECSLGKKPTDDTLSLSLFNIFMTSALGGAPATCWA